MNMMARVEPAADDGLTLEMLSGCPAVIDAIALAAAPDRAFLRSAWFRAAGAERTLLVRRGSGEPLAAFPLAPAGPPQLGATATAGSYWPFRSIPHAADASPHDLTAMMGHSRTRAALGPLWRMGPFYADDPGSASLMRAAAASGWTMLTRRLGHTFSLHVAALQAAGPWPRPSTLKRIRNYERQLGQHGAVEFQQVSGAGWTAEAFDALAQVEENSWVAATDRSGAKFISAKHRAFWQDVAADPVLASMLSALIVRVADRPVAFCFDLNVGSLQYSIAGSYDAAFAKVKVGKIATYRNIAWALEQGITRFDWGAGDSGYKSEIGAVRGSEIVDCLFVRSPAVAALLRRKWEGAPAGEGDEAGWLPVGRREMLIIGSLATAAAFGAMAE
jgi:CelD/BcsL family acetyltransferase involved in cellulose biosynthesis